MRNYSSLSTQHSSLTFCWGALAMPDMADLLTTAEVCRELGITTA